MFMFWKRFTELCLEQNTTPTAVVNELGLARGSVTKWKSGSSPNAKTVSKIAAHLKVSVSALLEEAESTNVITDSPEKKQLFDSILALTDSEVEQLSEYIDFIISKRSK
jgi:transcriptional regulator with XRE-family HTH domain